VTENGAGAGWHSRLVKPRLALSAPPLRPGEVGAVLCQVLLAPENLLEDAGYAKVAPNQFIVELPSETYARHYAPLEKQIREQWRERLLNHLSTANSRQGRREYHFAGQVSVEVRAAPDLAPGQLRIRSRTQPDAPGAPPPQALPACLELMAGGKNWALRTGIVTLGREPSCDLYFDNPRVQELRLVSGQHAYLHCLPDGYRLFDGTPQGVPSVNGTYVNGRAVPASGQLLSDGDVVILAAVRRDSPRLDTPGVVGLRFRATCA